MWSQKGQNPKKKDEPHKILVLGGKSGPQKGPLIELIMKNLELLPRLCGVDLDLRVMTPSELWNTCPKDRVRALAIDTIAITREHAQRMLEEHDVPKHAARYLELCLMTDCKFDENETEFGAQYRKRLERMCAVFRREPNLAKTASIKDLSSRFFPVEGQDSKVHYDSEIEKSRNSLSSASYSSVATSTARSDVSEPRIGSVDSNSRRSLASPSLSHGSTGYGTNAGLGSTNGDLDVRSRARAKSPAAGGVFAKKFRGNSRLTTLTLAAQALSNRFSRSSRSNLQSHSVSSRSASSVSVRSDSSATLPSAPEDENSRNDGILEQKLAGVICVTCGEADTTVKPIWIRTLQSLLKCPFVVLVTKHALNAPNGRKTVCKRLGISYHSSDDAAARDRDRTSSATSSSSHSNSGSVQAVSAASATPPSAPEVEKFNVQACESRGLLEGFEWLLQHPMNGIEYTPFTLIDGKSRSSAGGFQPGTPEHSVNSRDRMHLGVPLSASNNGADADADGVVVTRDSRLFGTISPLVVAPSFGSANRKKKGKSKGKSKRTTNEVFGKQREAAEAKEGDHTAIDIQEIR